MRRQVRSAKAHQVVGLAKLYVALIQLYHKVIFVQKSTVLPTVE